MNLTFVEAKRDSWYKENLTNNNLVQIKDLVLQLEIISLVKSCLAGSIMTTVFISCASGRSLIEVVLKGAFFKPACNAAFACKRLKLNVQVQT